MEEEVKEKEEEEKRNRMKKRRSKQVGFRELGLMTSKLWER